MDPLSLSTGALSTLLASLIYSPRLVVSPCVGSQLWQMIIEHVQKASPTLQDWERPQI